MSRPFDFAEYEFPVWMRRRRELLGLTQKDLADLTGIAQSYLSAIELGIYETSYLMRQKIIDVMPMLPSHALRQSRDEVFAIFDSYGQPRPKVFGSIARGCDTPDSDVDLLTKYKRPFGFGVNGLYHELEACLTFPVDVFGTDPDLLKGVEKNIYNTIVKEAVEL